MAAEKGSPADAGAYGAGAVSAASHSPRTASPQHPSDVRKGDNEEMASEQRFYVLVQGWNDGLKYRGRQCAEKEQRRMERNNSTLRGCITIVPA